ncbi:MAG: hypothetical protein Kow0099_20490 [Candidatus Abyssubacteria bacterium]
MLLHSLFYTVALFLTAAGTASLAVYVVSKKSTPGARVLALLMGAVAFWSFVYALELGGATLSVKIFWAKFKYFGIVAVPPIWLIFALQYTGRSHWVRPRLVPVLSVGPLAILTLVWTNEWHGLYWTGTTMETTDTLSVLSLPVGIGFWFSMAYQYLLLFLGTVVILDSYLRSHRIYRKQAGAMLLGAMVPWVSNGLSLIGATPIHHIDLTPFAFAITCMAGAFALFRLQLADLVPIAHHAVIQGMDDCVIVLDRHNRIIDLNPSAHALLQPSGCDVIGLSIQEALPGLSLQLEHSVDPDAPAREVMLGDEQSRRFYDMRISPLLGHGGHPTSKVMVLRDITTRKQTEEKLEGSLSLLRATLESTADGILVVHSEGKTVGYNRKFLNMWGLPESLAVSGCDIQRHSIFLKQLKDPQRFLNRLDGLHDNPEAEACEIIECNDGRTFERYTQPRRIGETIVGRVFSFRDISDNMRLQTQLLDTTNYLENLLETANDIIYTLDLEGSLTFVNRRAEEVTGYSREELVENSLAFLVHLDDLKDYARRFGKVLNGGCEASQIRFLRKDGQVIVLSVNETPIIKEGRPVGIFGIARDITKELALEEQLRQVQKLEAVGLLAGGIAHDFNNLLTVIVGHTQLAMLGMPDGSPTRENLHEVETAAQQAAGLVNQLLAFSRRQAVQLRLVNVNSVIDEMHNLLRRLIKEDTHLLVKPAPGLWPIKVDPNQLKQVILNLTLNARDATSPGGGITLRTENVTLGTEDITRIGNLKPGPYILLTVTDTGQGMTEEVQRRVFEPFFTTKPEGKGTGLGLSTAYGIIKRHGGHITVNSMLGRGTCFSVYLPVEDSLNEEEPLVGTTSFAHAFDSAR